MRAAAVTAAALVGLPAGAQGAGMVPVQPAASATAAAARLQRQLTGALAKSGPQVGALVEDIDSGQVLFSHDPDVARPPASVEKLYTTVAALNLLGPTARFPTRVLATGHMGRGGVWHGNLYLRGGGDPTFGDGGWNRTYEQGHGPTASQLAAQLEHDGIRRVTGRIFADESLFDTERGGPLTGDLPDLPDYGGELSALVYDHGMSTAKMSPAVYAAHELAITLRGIGMKVAAASRTEKTPPGAVLLARVESPPLAVLVRLMDVPSDDLIADMLAKQLGARYMGDGTLADGAIEIRQTIGNDYALHPTLFDGSGLDRADRSSPEDVVSLLRKVWATPTGNELYAALPIVGEQGTVQSLGIDTPAAGHCVAKTGTLNGVTNLAGYCRPAGGATLAFALMIDGPANWQSESVLSRAVAAVARY